MDQPLLGHSQRRFSFQHGFLRQNLARLAVEDEESPAPRPPPPQPEAITPLEFKEKLVYGSLESPAGYYLPRLFSASEGQEETEAFLAQGGGRRGYDFHPTVDDRGWVRYGPGKNEEELEDSSSSEDTAKMKRSSSLRRGSFFGGGGGGGDGGEPTMGRRSSSYTCVDDTTSLLATFSGSSSEFCHTPPETVDLKFPAKRKYLKKSRTAPALNVNFARKDQASKKKLKRPDLESAMTVVVQASIGLVIYLAIGVAIYVWRTDDFAGKSTLPVIDALYFCIVTMCTIGYGDITPISPSAKLFACFFVLVGFGFIDILLSGMVAYVLERQEHLLLSAVEGSHHETAKNYLVNTEKGRMRIRMKVGLALGVVFFCLAIGTLFMHWTEELGWLDSFYLSTMSVTTVGYGDHTFKTFRGRLFAAGWLLVSTLAVARSFLFLAEARIDKRNRLIAKWVLHREMTVGDLVAADIDNHGFVTKSEYVIYKLKEMGRISEKEIMDVCRQFNVLDKDGSGRITLSCLVNEENAVQ